MKRRIDAQGTVLHLTDTWDDVTDEAASPPKGWTVRRITIHEVQCNRCQAHRVGLGNMTGQQLLAAIAEHEAGHAS